MKRKAFDDLTAHTGGNLTFCGMYKQRLCVTFIAGMSRRCVLRAPLVQRLLSDMSSIVAPRPNCKLMRNVALIPTNHTALLSSAILPVRYRIYTLLELIAVKQTYTVNDGTF